MPQETVSTLAKLETKGLTLYSYTCNKQRIIVLHEHWEGCIEIANPAGLISSQGAKPRGMRNESQGI